VKVYGIPLHVWGENLFKAIGSRYGEFIDFDNNTASRAKLDVARIKMATGFCGEIDDALKIMALGLNIPYEWSKKKEWNRCLCTAIGRLSRRGAGLSLIMLRWR
jgi:hypothetical protein